MPLEIQLMSQDHYSGGFLCDVLALDSFLKKRALSDAAKDLSRTYVLFDSDDPDKEILSYIAVCASSITKVIAEAELKKRKTGNLAYPAIPVFHVAKLATHREHTGQGYATFLMIHAFKLAITLSQSLGIMGVHLLATDPDAISLYVKLGYKSLPDNNYFIHISDLREAYK